MSLYAYAMFLFYVWNSFIALLNLIVIAIITRRSEIKVTSMLIVAQCLMRDTLSYQWSSLHDGGNPLFNRWTNIL
jgi:hypothetical protein